MEILVKSSKSFRISRDGGEINFLRATFHRASFVTHTQTHTPAFRHARARLYRPLVAYKCTQTHRRRRFGRVFQSKIDYPSVLARYDRAGRGWIGGGFGAGGDSRCVRERGEGTMSDSVYVKHKTRESSRYVCAHTYNTRTRQTSIN